MDSDSFTIGIDNHASTTISKRSSHFIRVITPVKGKMVKGFRGMIQVKVEGKIIWKMEDGDGIIYPIKTKKALYAPESLSCLLAQKKGHNRQRKTIKILTAPGEPPRPATACYIRTRNATTVQPPGILQLMYPEFNQLHHQTLTKSFLQPMKKNSIGKT